MLPKFRKFDWSQKWRYVCDKGEIYAAIERLNSLQWEYCIFIKKDNMEIIIDEGTSFLKWTAAKKAQRLAEEYILNKLMVGDTSELDEMAF